MSTIKVDTIATRTGSGNITLSNSLADVTINRTGNGVAQTIQNSGTTVGQIGVNSTDNMYLVSTNTGFKLLKDEAAIAPAQSGGSNHDNALDLGVSGVRWKDLYLSGGLYVGGTDQAHKFDDYEEGTFTPAITGLTLSTALGHYTKIGNVVHWGVQLGIPSTSANTHFKINNPPFANATNQFGGAVIYANHNVVDNPTVIVVSGEIQWYKNGSSFVTYADYSGKDVRASGAYLTS